MKMPADRTKTLWFFTIFSGLVFFLLLGYRLDLFHKQFTDVPRVKPLLFEKDSWMNIFQKHQKIGYAHRQITPRSKGYRLSESTRMRINTMGMVQDIYSSISGELRPDFSVSSFAFDMQSSLFHFRMKGKRDGEFLRINADKQEIRIPLKDTLFLASSAPEAAFNSLTTPGESRTLWVFDPMTMNRRPVTITMMGNEILHVMGQSHSVRKISIEMMGVSQTTWIDPDGNILQQDGLLGIRLQKTTKKSALEDPAITASSDLTEMVSISSNVILKKPGELSRLALMISGIPKTIHLNGGRQVWKAPELTISRESVPGTGETNETVPPRFLAPTPFIQSDHPEIQKQVSQIVAPDDSPQLKARKIMGWIHTHIEKRPVLSVPNALETYRNRMGDCNEHSVLFAAMLRAADIPSQIETGLVYANGRFYYHAWNSLFLGKWVTADALMGQLPADVTHIRLVRGEPDQQMDLIAIIGNIDLKIMGFHHDPIE